jgi:hypothetical protein
MAVLVSGITDTAAKARAVFMQFTGKKGNALFVGLISGACIIGFGSGLLVGRQFPAHHYERFGNSSYLLDPSTGRVCDPFKVSDKTGQKPPSGSDKPTVDLSDIWGSKPSGPPACEK